MNYCKVVNSCEHIIPKTTVYATVTAANKAFFLLWLDLVLLMHYNKEKMNS